MTRADSAGAEGQAGGTGGLLGVVWAGTPVEAATGDRAWVRALLAAESALARAQAALGWLEPADAELITDVAAVCDPDPVALARASRGGGNPVIPLVGELTSAVAQHSARAAESVHLGVTSQDIMDTATMLVCRRALDPMVGDLDRIAGSLADLARRHRNTLMPGRTLTQHAVPVTFGLKVAGWLGQLLDARAELARCLQRLPVQLGGAAGTLAALEEHRKRAGAAGSAVELLGRFATELGLAEPTLPWHTARAPVAALGAALGLAGGAVGKLALDVTTLSRTELGELAEPAGEGRGGSSTMPQKRNPVLSTLIVAAARQLPAHAALLSQSLLAADERPAGAWHAEWQPLREAMRLAAGAVHTAVELAGGLEVHADRMRADADLTGGGLVAERLSILLAADLGRQRAKQVVAEAVRRAWQESRELPAVLAELPAVADRYSPAELTSLCDPARYTGAAGQLIDRVLARVDP